MKLKHGRNVGVVTVNSDVIDKVAYMSESTYEAAKLVVTFHSGREYEVFGSEASDIWASFNLVVSNNDSIGQWFNREVKNRYVLERA